LAIGLLAAATLTILNGCMAMPIMDGAAGFVASGAGRPNQAQIFNGFADQRSQQAFSRGIVDQPGDPIFDDGSRFWFGRRRY
jgi:hypothetical protein